MAEYFSFKGKDECGTSRYIDIPQSACANGVQLLAYHCFHGGVNQQWRLNEQGRIVSAMSPNFCLSAESLQDGAVIALKYLDSVVDSDTTNNAWTIKDGFIKLKARDNFYLGLVNEKLLLRKVSSTGYTTKWLMDPVEPKVKPATSCHLQYEPIPQDGVSDGWTLENSVRVKHSANSTYFCVIGFGPGGYAGIQQVSDTHKVVIFSMWNDNENDVAEAERGDNVSVRSFGGEGTGMKAMKPLQWKVCQNIRFRVTGKKDANGVWRCSCWFRVENGDWVFVASFERSGSAPFNNHFYSFVEDWDRANNCEGHVLQRCAEYFDAQVITGSDETHHLHDVIFTKVTDGADKFGVDKALCGVNADKRCFVLTTGGDSSKYVKDYLDMDGCQQSTSLSLAKLKM